MIKVGNPPYLECSSKGDKRFSAFYAKPASLNGKSIEEAYQGAKVFSDGSTNLHWRKAKGRIAVNQIELAILYKQWWKDWILEQNLLPILKQAKGLSDIFGQGGHICQAIILWQLRSEL